MTLRTTRHTYCLERAYDANGRCIQAKWRETFTILPPSGCTLVGCVYEDDCLVLVWRERGGLSSAALALAGIVVLFAVAAALAWLRAHS